MAAREKTRDELDMKTLRELAALPSNKFCFDCGQRGPTYVNVTIGAFVCSACGGLLRGLNPPHRVKSLTVCSFTEVEMDRIKSRGNEYCTHIWLGKYDAKSGEMDFSSPDKRREFMRLKYEEKKYYVDPREAIKKMKPRAPAVPATVSSSVTQSKSHTVIQNKDTYLLQKSGALSQTFSAGDVLNNTSDLFKDFENDPFKEAKDTDNKSNNASFADFSSAFGNTESKAVSSGQSSKVQSPSISSSSSVALTSGINSSTSHKKPAPPPPDRYAALADLDNQLHQQVVSEMPVSIPSVITTSTSVYWPTTTMPSTAAIFTAVSGPPNPFNSAWPQPTISTQNPFQGVQHSIPVGLNKPAVSQLNSTSLSTVKPSLPNGSVNPVWPTAPNQTWATQFQNGQSDAFQSKTADNNPWSQPYGGVTSANPFMNGSFGSGQASNVAHTNAGKNPFL